MVTPHRTTGLPKTVTILFPATVRNSILEQHEALRSSLRHLMDETTSSLTSSSASKDRLTTPTRELVGRFRKHLAFEELHLVPVLRRDECWGPERVSALLAEHERQRAELDTLMDGVEGDWDVYRIAFVLRSVITDLLIDMEAEERGVLESDGLTDAIAVSTERHE